MNYTVTVGNVGNVHESTSGANAWRDFWEYKKASASGIGKVGGEPVTLMGDGEITKEHLPSEVKS